MRRSRQSSTTRASALALLALACAAAPAHAGWEAAQRVDHTSDAYLNSPDVDVALARNGLATVLFWQRQDGSSTSGDPFMARRAADAAAFGTPVAVAPAGSSNSSTRTEVAAAPDGSVVAAFQYTLDVFGAAWGAGAAAPSERTRVLDANDGTPDARPDVAVDAAGNGYVASVEGPSSNRDVKLARWDAATGAWQPPETIDGDAGARVPRVAVNDRGDLAISYAKPGPGGDDVVVVRRRPAGGELSAAHQVSQSPASEANDVDQHDVAIAADGTIVVAFAQNANDQANGLRRAADRVYAVRWLAGAPAPRVEDNQRALSSEATDAGAAAYPVAVASPQGGAFLVAWQQVTSFLPGAGTGVYASELVGSTWSAAQQATPSVQLVGGRALLDVALDAAGTATLVWAQGGRVRASQRASGHSFTPAEAIAATGGGEASATTAPRVAAERAGEAYVAFLAEVGDTEPGTANPERNRAFAARFTGDAPGGSVAPGDCPAGNNGIEGGPGDDRLAGTAAADNVFGRAGNDVLAGLAGADCLRGEQGDDDLGGAEGRDDVAGGDGNDVARGDQDGDVLAGEAGADVLAGGAGSDRILGGDDADRISGGDDADEVEGGAGSDRIFLGSGDDFARGGDGDDVVSVGAGTDRAFGEGGNDRMRASSGRARLDGGDGADRLRGGSARDTLIGGAGLDTLFGLAGNDLLIGGDDLDIVKGGDGHDRIAGRAGDDRLRGGPGRDRITGAAGDDRIWGDGGRDRIVAGSGDDVVHAADGERDSIACGAGRDRVIADRGDRVARSCERVKLRAARRPRA